MKWKRYRLVSKIEEYSDYDIQMLKRMMDIRVAQIDKFD